MTLEEKQAEFNRAIGRFEKEPVYRYFGLGVAGANVALQAALVWRAAGSGAGAAAALISAAAAYVAADLVNGLVHMYQDNNEDYTSVAGPFNAAFHLHHKIPRYTERPLPLVYFLESGSKVWLVPVQAASALYAFLPGASPALLWFLAAFGVLSSAAEVSHYLAHNSLSRAAAFLAGCGLLLSKRHHGRHHNSDNASYAFLNGMTDPLLDRLAARLYTGYKNGTDLHYARYSAVARK